MKRTPLIFKKLLKLTEEKVGCLIWDLTAVLSVNNIVIKKQNRITHWILWIRECTSRFDDHDKSIKVRLKK